MSTQFEIEDEALESGADAFVSKGTPPSKILEVLKRMQDELDKEERS